MKKTVLFIVLLLCLIGCKESIQEIQPIENQTQITEIQEPVKNTRYVLVVFEVDEPKLIYREPIYSIGYTYKISDAYYDIEWISKIYCSDIEKIEDFNQDIAYQLMDIYEKNVPKTPHVSFSDDVFNSTTSNREMYEKLMRLGVPKVTDRYYLTFNNYKDASIKRREILNLDY